MADYCDVEDLREYLRIGDNADDTILQLAVTSASALIDYYCNQTFDVIPAGVTQACLLQASRFVVRRDAPFGVAGSPEAGTEIRLRSELDPDVRVVLKPYVSWWGAVGPDES